MQAVQQLPLSCPTRVCFTGFMSHIMGAVIKTTRMSLTTRNIVDIKEVFTLDEDIPYYSDCSPTGLVVSLVFEVTVHSISSVPQYSRSSA